MIRARIFDHDQTILSSLEGWEDQQVAVEWRDLRGLILPPPTFKSVGV